MLFIVFVFSVAAPETGLKFEIWDGIPGKEIFNLTNNNDFPNNPSMTEKLTTFDTPYNRADNYGARVITYYLVSTLVQRLYVVAPAREEGGAPMFFRVGFQIRPNPMKNCRGVGSLADCVA